MSSRNESHEYLIEAASWDADRRALDHRSRRTAWIVAAIAAVTACTAVTALVILLPLKRVEPYVIRVDNSTGIVDVVPAYTGNTPASETVTRFLLTHYVATCERFNFATAEEDYSECGAFHSPQRNQQWAAAWATGNPDSPLNRFKDGTTVHVDIQSVSFFDRASGQSDLAQVRFLKVTRAGGEGGEVVTHWIATIHYAYQRPSTDDKTRRWNPLGFKILHYQREPEVIDSATTVAAAGARP